ncbi:carbohydrate kinase family protein [Nonomuraea sp. M3C6]|uniref:Carbohydrate kinase family protein n=1 Tax=Nonomuraea marmarensis TaxID=3351344 RepID=A0ABW7AL58_9ACTN
MTGPRKLDLLAIGDADVDVYLRGPRAEPGQKVLGDLLDVAPGGMSANVACAAARLGSRAGLAAPLGEDPFASAALAYYAEVGLDTRYVRQVAGARTYMSVVQLDEQGEKSLTVARTSAFFPTLDHLRDIDFRAVRAVQIAPFAEAEARWAARSARDAGCLVAMDIEAGMLDGITDLDALVAPVDVLFVNEFAAAAAGLDFLRTLSPSVVVMTLGAHGAVVAAGSDVETVEAMPADVVDTTGAGDCFSAGFLVAYLDGANAFDSARFGAATAAFAIGAIGGSQGVPDRDVVTAALADRPKRSRSGSK